MEQAAQLATALQLSVKTLQFYTAEHPRVIEALVHLEQTANSLLEQKPRITLTVGKGTLLVDGEPFLNPPNQVRTLAADLERRSFGGLIFLAGASRRELLELVRLLSLRPEQIKAGGGPDEILRNAEVVHLRISHVRYEAVTEQEEVVWSRSVRHVDPHDLTASLPALLKSMEAGEPVNMDEIRSLLDAAANNDEQLTLLRERLVDQGVSREELDELLEVFTWEKLSLDERVEKLLANDRLFTFAAAKFQRFMRELVEAGRMGEVQRLLERYVTGLQKDAPMVRAQVCDGLGQIVTFHLPRELEQLAGTAILNHFVIESDPAVRPVSAEAAASFVGVLVNTSRCEPALRVLERLAAAAPDAAPHLAKCLGEPQRAEGIITQLGSADADTYSRAILPFVVHLGANIAGPIVEALGNEEDRNRRGRLVKALKAIGEPAYPSLLDTLQSPVWFVVRNSLNVLGDVGSTAQVEAIGKTLQHGDARVRRAATRALGKIGGPGAEKLLVGAMNDRDPETQAEVLLCLGAMKATTAIPGVSELAKAKLLGTDEKVRELAVTTLGQIGSDAAVPVLGEILRPKGFFVREPPMIRIAAAKALAAIKTPAAQDLVRSAAGAETDRTTKAALQKLV